MPRPLEMSFMRKRAGFVSLVGHVTWLMPERLRLSVTTGNTESRLVYNFTLIICFFFDKIQISQPAVRICKETGKHQEQYRSLYTFSTLLTLGVEKVDVPEV